MLLGINSKDNFLSMHLKYLGTSNEGIKRLKAKVKWLLKIKIDSLQRNDNGWFFVNIKGLAISRDIQAIPI